MNEAPIFPRRSAHIATLFITLAVMCYLACLAVGGWLVVSRSTARWAQGLVSEATVVIRQLPEADTSAEQDKAVAILEQEKGILAVKPLGPEAAARLLRPWLGQTASSDLPLPRLIALSLDENHPPDFSAIAQDLKAVKGASLDTHQRWQAAFTALGRNLGLLAAAILALITIATVALVAYAARSVMEANRNVVEVLELAGAEPGFIAAANDRAFLSAGSAAGTAGLAGALLTFAAIGFAQVPGTEALISTGQQALLGREDLPQTLGLLLLVPILATLIAVWTARLTLLRLLGRGA
jgi:cell division transport system permease protein